MDQGGICQAGLHSSTVAVHLSRRWTKEAIHQAVALVLMDCQEVLEAVVVVSEAALGVSHGNRLQDEEEVGVVHRQAHRQVRRSSGSPLSIRHYCSRDC